MKFQIALTAFAALALAQDSSAANQTSAAPAPTQTPVLTPEAKCIIDNKCNNDLGCLSKCAGVPNPSTDQINKTNSCVAGCDQSNTEKYAVCLKDCIEGNYLQHPNAGNGNNGSNGGNGNNGDKSNSSSTNKGSNGYKLAPVSISAFVGLSLLALSL